MIRIGEFPCFDEGANGAVPFAVFARRMIRWLGKAERGQQYASDKKVNRDCFHGRLALF